MNKRQENMDSSDVSPERPVNPELSIPASIAPEQTLSWAAALLADSVVRFHQRFQTGSLNKSHQVLSVKQKLKARDFLLKEELREYYAALENESTDAALEELADVLYVIIGHFEAVRNVTAINNVRAKNDAKVPENYGKASDGKIRKRVKKQ